MDLMISCVKDVWSRTSILVSFGIGIAGTSCMLMIYECFRRQRSESNKLEVKPEVIQTNANVSDALHQMSADVKELCDYCVNQWKTLNANEFQKLWKAVRANERTKEERQKEMDEYKNLESEIRTIRLWIGSFKPRAPAVIESPQQDDSEGDTVVLSENWASLQEELELIKRETEALIYQFKGDFQRDLQAQNNANIGKLDSLIAETSNNTKPLLTDVRERCESALLDYEDQLSKILKEWKSFMQTVQFKYFDSTTKKLKYLDLEKNAKDIRHRPVVFQWTISEIEEKLMSLKEKNEAIRHEEGFDMGDGVKLVPVLSCKGAKNVNIGIEFKDQWLKENISTLDFMHHRKYVIVDQSEDEPKEDLVMVDRPSFGINSALYMAMSNFNFWHLCRLDFLLGPNKYVKDDSIIIRTILEPISHVANNVASTDGVLVWEVDNYSKKKKAEVEGDVYSYISKPFKTSDKGYTMHVELSLNGDDDFEGKGLSVYLHVLLGDSDKDLPMPFKCLFTFTLMDQTDSGMHIAFNSETCTFKPANLNRGFPDFVPRETVESSPYLVNDTIKIKAEVKIL